MFTAIPRVCLLRPGIAAGQNRGRKADQVGSLCQLQVGLGVQLRVPSQQAAGGRRGKDAGVPDPLFPLPPPPP